MINFDSNLILVKGEDKTASILGLRCDKQNGFTYITYKNGREYTYRTSDVLILTSPTEVDAEGKTVLKNNVVLRNVEKVQFFHHYFQEYCRICYKNKRVEICLHNKIKIIDSILKQEEAQKVFHYLTDISEKVGIFVQQNNILFDQYSKIDNIREDCVLASYLIGKYNCENTVRSQKSVVYPFGFNLSQKRAVENALGNQISIIEGPPGTGKTQTILNIIANAVMRGESVAVVSSNNSATANVYEKLQKYGVEFIAAQLGNSSNKLAFIEAQKSTLPNILTWRRDRRNITQLLQEEAELNQRLEWKNELSALEQELSAITKEYQHFSDCNVVEYNKSMPVFSEKTTAAKVLTFLAEYEISSISTAKIGFFKKLFLILKYGFKRFVASDQPIDKVQQYCQNIYYKKRIKEIKEGIQNITNNLNSFNFDAKMKHYSKLSMEVFKSELFNKYAPMGAVRQCYSAEDLWKHSEEFIKDYPVISACTICQS